MFRPYDERPQFSRKASTFEWIVVGLVQWVMSTYTPDGPSQHMFGDTISQSFYLFRKYRLGHANLGDSTYTKVSENGVNGYWIHSPTRGEIHDIVVFYIHGGGFQRTSTFFYMEYFLTLLVSMQLQGFRNPAIFAVNYGHVPEFQFQDQLDQIAKAWLYLTVELNFDNISIVGDSNGGTLVLSLLLHIVHPYPGVEVVSTKQPSAAIAVSPFTKITGPWFISDSDYITEHVLSRYMSYYSRELNTDRTDPHVCPGLCRSKYWWNKAIPSRGGLYLMYGEDETLAGDVEELYQGIKELGRVARDIEPNHVHSWPLVSLYLGRNKSSRTRGIDKISSNLARMVLWNTATESNEELIIELNKERWALEKYLDNTQRPTVFDP